MRKGLLRFVLIFGSILVLVMSYVSWRLAREPIHNVVVGTMALLMLSLPILQWRRDAGPSRVRDFFLYATYFSMGFSSSLLALALVRDLLGLTVFRLMSETFSQRWMDLTGGTNAFFAAFLFTAFGIFWALRGPRIREVKISIPGLPKALHGLHFVQITDLHVGSAIGLDYVERLVGLIEGLKPDFTVLTGDIVDGDVAKLRMAVEPMARMAKIHPVLYSPGNHEYYQDFGHWMLEFQRLGMEVLLNRGAMIELKGQSIWVGGVTDPAAVQTHKGDGPDISKAMEGGESALFKLLLSHRPSLVEEAAEAGFHLQLSGHTHGGQFFPWTFFFRFAHRYYLGLMKFKSMWIYVSPGTGSWGPPIRLGTTPELTSLRLESV